MPDSICPWWVGYLLATPLRRWIHDPMQILRPYVREGMTVFEPGPGMGFFTIPLARLVGPSGRVIAVDVQPRMIASLKRRAAKAKVSDRIEARVTSAETLGVVDLAGTVDCTLAFAMVHEFPSAAKFFSQVRDVSRPGAQLLLAEPRGHVNETRFDSELKDAAEAHFQPVERPVIRRMRSALRVKS